MNPDKPEQTPASGTRSRTRIIVGSILTIMIIAGLALGGLEIWQVHNNNKASTCSTGNVCSSTSKSGSTKNGSSASSTVPKTSGGNSTQTTPSPTPQPTSSTQQPLTNTGPGNVFGVFIVATAIGYVAHRIFSLSKSLNK